MAERENTTPPHGDRGCPGAGSGYEKKFTAEFRKNPPPRSPARGTSASTTMTACWSSKKPRPDQLSAVSGPQERVPRRIVEQIDDSAPVVPSLHDPEPQMEEQSVEVLLFFLQRWQVAAEQTENCERRLVIDVPKISPDQTLQRLGDSLRQPQTAQKLVEVPGFEFVFVRRVEGAHSTAVCRAAGHTWTMRVHDTGWSDTAAPGRFSNTGHR